MTAVGGSVESISLHGRTFPVAADAATQRKLGGFANEVLANGDGTARLKKTRETWSITDIQIVIDDNRDDQGFLQSLADTTDYFDIDITYASGFTWMGTGQITDQPACDSMAATASVNLAGPNKLQRQ